MPTFTKLFQTRMVASSRRGRASRSSTRCPLVPPRSFRSRRSVAPREKRATSLADMAAEAKSSTAMATRADQVAGSGTVAVIRTASGKGSGGGSKAGDHVPHGPPQKGRSSTSSEALPPAGAGWAGAAARWGWAWGSVYSR